MKITTIRLRKLVSTPHGYGHHAAELEAQIEDGETYEDVAAELERRLETQLRQGRERDKLVETLDDLRREVKCNEDRLDRLRAQIAEGKAIIAVHNKLRDHAEAQGLTWDDKGNQLPFAVKATR